MNEDEKVYWGLPVKYWFILGVMVILIAYPFYNTIQDMIYRWDTKEEYGYGYIIPFLTLFLIWQRKNVLSEKPFEPTFWAIPLLILSGIMYFVGEVSTTNTLSQYALVFTILGLAYGVLGWQRFKIVAVPIALLFFMVPLPPFIYNNLSGKLQLISSELGVAVIRLFGVSVYLEGNVIDLGMFKLQVAEACSGLRYLFPLVSLSFIAAYLYRVEVWKRVVVFLSSIPITVFMNSFRIGVIGVLVKYFGIEQAEGFLHQFEGWVIFMACMSMLLLEMTLLARIGNKKRRLLDVFGIELPEPLEKKRTRHNQKISIVHYSIIVTLIFYSFSTIYIDKRKDVKLVRKDFSEYPLIIGQWEGKKEILQQDILDSLKATDYIVANYVHENRVVNLYIAYYASQEAGEAAHSPRACIPGGGWLIDRLTTIKVGGVNEDGVPLSANRLVIKKGDYSQLVYYWFQQRGRIITNEYLVKWYLFWDALTENRTDGALIRLTTPVNPGDDIKTADKRLVSFLKLNEPLMDQYIPR